MARLRTKVERAATLHRQAAAAVAVAAAAIDGASPATAVAEHYAQQRDLAARLRDAAARLAPGWLGRPLDALAPTTPLGGDGAPTHVRIGQATPLDDASFPVVVPLLGAGHLAVDADARDPRVAGLLRSLVLRLLAAAPPGQLRVRTVDTAGAGTTFTRFHGIETLMPPPVTDRAGLRAVLDEAEQWVRAPTTDGRMQLVVIASLPELTEGRDLARIAGLAQAGPPARLHLVVAGWPPPPLTAETTQAPLPRCTHITLRNPYAWVGDPPGATFGAGPPPGRLGAPAYLDPDPPVDLIRRVCDELAARRVRFGVADLLGEPLWQHTAVDNLETAVGRTSDDAPYLLRFDDACPHWMVGGRSGSGKTAFLLNVLYGLSTRYSPDELHLYLLDFKEGVSFSEFAPSARDPQWLPHARAVGIESDREYGLAVLRELDAETTRRATAYKEAGVTRYADLRRAGRSLPRVVCVVDEFQVLLTGNDAIAREATGLLESLARTGRSYGVHLVLSSQTARGVEALYGKRDSIFGQFAVRVALPGGGDVLDPMRPTDDAAALPLGSAIVNTAAGTTGFDTTVRFPDPHADPAVLAEARHRMWQARPPAAGPPSVFAGQAQARLDDDPVYRALREGGPGGSPRVLLGRFIDVPGSTAAFPLDAAPGRHVAVLGPDPAGAGILAAAALSLAVQHAPGTVRFSVPAPVDDAAAVAGEVVAALRAAGHEVSAEDPTYVLAFGADGHDLRETLHSGQSHVLGWWRGVRRFQDDTGAALDREAVGCLLFTNVPGPDAALLLGQPVDWQPRPNRALLHDRHANRTAVIVPFVHDGQSR